MLRLENLAKLYGLKVVFKGVSCRFTAGSITLLAGGNGAGKSTTIKLILNFISSWVHFFYCFKYNLLNIIRKTIKECWVYTCASYINI